MMNEKLIAYLEKQKAERDVVLADYDDAKAAVAAAEAVLAAANARVESFGDVSAIEAERDEIQGFIDSLIPQENEADEVVEEDVAETVEGDAVEASEDECAECVVPEAPVAADVAAVPAAPSIESAFDAVM